MAYGRSVRVQRRSHLGNVSNRLTWEGSIDARCNMHLKGFMLCLPPSPVTFPDTGHNRTALQPDGAHGNCSATTKMIISSYFELFYHHHRSQHHLFLKEKVGDYVLLQFEQIAAKTFVLSKHFIQQISIVRLENKERDVSRKKTGP